MERVALGYVRRLREGAEEQAPAWPNFHDSTLRTLTRIERSAIWKAAISGLICGLAASAMAWGVETELAADPQAFHPWIQRWPWLLSGALGAIPTVMEIVYLYVLGLNTVHRLEQVAGVPGAEASHQAVADLGLVRTALDMPNPNRVTLGIDPLRSASKLELLLLTLIYKAKIGITTFLIRITFKRVLGRTVLRGIGQIASAPAYCIWNALVFRKLVRESRLRILGPALARTIVEDLRLSECRQLAVRAIAVLIVSRQDMHPNHHQLLEALEAGRVEVPVEDREAFVRELMEQPAELRARITSLMGACLAVAGKLPRKDKKLLAWLDEGPLPLRSREVQAFAQALWNEGWLPRERIDGHVAALSSASQEQAAP